jgi:DNA-binding IclR family transcriptional regulator
MAETTIDGIQALETGAQILRCFAHAAQPLMLSSVAAQTGMPPGKVHRYLRGFIAARLLVQDTATRRYDLGPLAYSLGVAALQRHDLVREASNRLPELRAATNESVSLLIWGDRGPVVIRSEESRRDVAVILRVGGVVRLTTSSAGAIFAAYLPPAETAATIAAELAEHPIVNGARLTAEAFAMRVAEIRERGLSFVENGPVANAAALSAPLFAPDGRVIAAVSVVGQAGRMAHDAGSLVDRELRAFIARIQSGESAQPE